MLGRVLQGVSQRHNFQMYDTPRLLHPWQFGPLLPDRFSFDLSNHYNQLPPCPDGLDISKHNELVLISAPSSQVLGIDAAYFGM